MEYTGPLDTIERPNHDILIIGIEVEEVQAKGIRNIFNKKAENLPKLKKEIHIGYRKSPGHQTPMTKIETFKPRMS
jgi:hypothetical protein